MVLQYYLDRPFVSTAIESAWIRLFISNFIVLLLKWTTGKLLCIGLNSLMIFSETCWIECLNSSSEHRIILKWWCTFVGIKWLNLISCENYFYLCNLSQQCTIAPYFKHHPSYFSPLLHTDTRYHEPINSWSVLKYPVSLENGRQRYSKMYFGVPFCVPSFLFLYLHLSLYL